MGGCLSGKMAAPPKPGQVSLLVPFYCWPDALVFGEMVRRRPETLSLRYSSRECQVCSWERDGINFDACRVSATAAAHHQRRASTAPRSLHAVPPLQDGSQSARAGRLLEAVCRRQATGLGLRLKVCHCHVRWEPRPPLEEPLRRQVRCQGLS